MHALAHVQHRARCFHAGAAAGRQKMRQRAAAQVNVEIVNAHRALADAHLAGPRRRRLAFFGLQLVGAAVLRHPHAPRRHRQGARHGLLAATRAALVRALCQVAAQVVEAGFVHTLGDHFAQFAFLPRRGGEGGFPVPEGAVTVGHGLERDGSHITLQRHGCFDNAVGALVGLLVQRQQLFADAVAVFQGEAAHAAHLVALVGAFDAAAGHHGVPLRVAVEVAQHGPDARKRRVNDGGPNNFLQHGGWPAPTCGRSSASGRRNRPGTHRRRCSR